MLLKERIAVTTILVQGWSRAACGMLLAALVIAVSTGGFAQQPAALGRGLWVRPEVFERRAARGSRHLVLLDRRRRALLGRDGPGHRRQRQPAQLSRLAPARAALPRTGCDHAARLRSGDRPDQYGLWLDRCDQPAVPGVPGEASGIVGLRRFPNPRFDPTKWDAAKYLQHPGRHAAAVPGRHDLRLLPHRLQPDQTARRSRAADLGEPGRHHRQPVLGGRKTVQPQHEAG